MYSILIGLLLLSHVLSDFYFQNDGMSTQKKTSVKVLLLHSLIYLILSVVACIPFLKLNIFIRLVILGISHIVIDYIKIAFDKLIMHNKCSLFTFSIDQLLHILMIFILFPVVLEPSLNGIFTAIIPCLSIYYPVLGLTPHSIIAQLILLTSFILFLANAGTVVTKMILNPYIEKINRLKDPCVTEKDTISNSEFDINAGKIIGVLERIIVFCLIISNNYSAIAIVIAAKTAVRFKQLDKQYYSEYYLIGTLSSSVIAILFGVFWNLIKVYI